MTMLTNEELDNLREWSKTSDRIAGLNTAHEIITQAREANALREEVERLRANKSLIDTQNDRFRDELEKQDAELTRLRSVAEAAVAALRRVGDRRMWREDTRGLVWEGETPDGNLIEADDPRDICTASLPAPRESGGEKS